MTDNRTTELREKLTERGVEWTKPNSATEFIQTTFLCNGWGIEVLERNIGLCVTATNIFDTPEQAIAATLGEQIVRCRDCRHMHTVRNWLGMDVDECWLHADPESGALGKERTEPDGFCSWGERKEVD